MDTKDIVIIVVVTVALGFSLYRKFVRKDQDKYGGTGKSSQTGSIQSFHQKDDDYEPYSGK